MAEANVLEYAQRSAPPPPKLRAIAAVLLPILYLPYAWLIFSHHSWDDYDIHWLKMWPILPGVLAGVVLFTISSIQYLGMACATIFLIAVTFWTARRSRVALVWTAVLLAIFSIYNSWVAYSLFSF